MDVVNQGQLCLIVTQALVAKFGEVELAVLFDRLEQAGWQHSLTTRRQKRKHIYEVLRQARRDGKTCLRLQGDYVIVE
jgi:hypothetical protein